MAYPFVQDVVREWTGLQLYLPLPTFGMMVGLAVFVGMAVTRREVRRLETRGQLPVAPLRASDVVTDMTMISVFVGMVGARIFHILEYPADFIKDPGAMIFARGGYSIYGGLLFGLTAGVLYLRHRKIPVLRMADASGIGLILGYGIGRLGCQISGDGDWGIAANMALKPSWLPDWFWAQPYEHNIVGETILPPGVYPTPLYESAMAFLIFAILWLNRRHKFQPGWLFSLYLLCNGIERFFIEKIRINSTYKLFGFHPTQAEIISVILIIMGSIGVFYFTKHRARAIDSKYSPIRDF